ncbi:MAG: prefoldin subunit alpha [Candidatus Thorarchaeota archaeon]|nr:prefoldin subunit alpha [Candidatus Thorarchaeota archaeon]
MTEEQQEQFQKLYNEQQAVNANLEAVRERLEVLQLYLNNYRIGLMVLEELAKRAEGDEVLLAVGGGLFVQARLRSTAKVFRDIGSGVRIESTVEDAKKYAQESIASLEKQYESLSSENQKLSNYVTALNTQLQELVTKIQRQTRGA